MIILSFDVGIVHLAYCLFTKEDNKWKILEWANIDLTDRESKICSCGLKASLIYNNNFYCKVHAKKCEPIKNYEELFSENKNSVCSFIGKQNCNKKSSMEYTNTKECFCTTHSKSKYKNLQNLFKVKPFKIKNINTLDFDDTRLKLFTILGEKIELLKADVVLIENQPSMKNPTMKSISNALYDFYLIRGIIDKERTKSDIVKVKFMSPSNKLKLADENDTKKLVIAKKTDETTGYKMTKALGIKYCTEMISHLPEWSDFIKKQKKKDDLCDAFLQGAYYFEKNLAKNNK
jgi:hypothetical protein